MSERNDIDNDRVYRGPDVSDYCDEKDDLDKAIEWLGQFKAHPGGDASVMRMALECIRDRLNALEESERLRNAEDTEPQDPPNSCSYSELT